MSLFSIYVAFFIVNNKLGRGFYILKSLGGSINALSQVATKGHLKQILFSIIFKDALTAFALVTASVLVC